MENEKDASSYRKSIQRQMVHIFLTGLDGEFEQIRGEILRKDHVLELEECYSMVRRESIRHATVNGDLEKSETVAIVSEYRSNQNRLSQNQPDRMRSKGINKSTYKCTHCDQSGHIKDHCFEIVGYPEWWDHNRDSRRRNASKSSTAAIVETNAKEDVAGQSTTLVATRGNNGKALNSFALVSNNTWIIDSGATDNMTFDSRQVSSLKPSSQKYIFTANSSSTPIIGERSLSLINNLNLDNVLVVPSLDCNLLSVSQITTTLSCVVMFWPTYCVFKDI
ncbi:hypothetical protein KY290_005874 [Solanum tuberosum]|uniref:Retrovirus-related Pol polyprotein from transposon TNT 1-94-like beta-barrel domain-containing protein n=1 Tax=Solanum tuberosum TaxID=4113 RepID=A0ABQ7WHT5_SOLTU|nr:hypothetical protein KY284_005887 [Solanum tuberosum]KAH0723150.1 hypothetical protein KY289_006194 [Solanum tuberosum]KAH0752588.1 hypothetical protein KY285_005736 [Solanum tuberosum]KAH0779447.1 hypothetical protein KY290_005874 [Solanum tuberosum]